MKLELFALLLTFNNVFSFRDSYFVEETINFGTISQNMNYVCLLNSIDGDTEHSKALFSNMTHILDTNLNTLNNLWTIPYSVNYIPSLGTDFNLIFTENEITADHFKESNLLGFYHISDNFRILSDKDIELNYNNQTIFQPGETIIFTLQDFKNTIQVELLSKSEQDDPWIMYPNLQRYVSERFIYNPTNIYNYSYNTPIDLQKYFNVDFKLKFTEVYNSIKTVYTLESFQFNVPGISIIDSYVYPEYIQLLVEYKNLSEFVIIEVKAGNYLVDTFNYKLDDNHIIIDNVYNTSNYTINIIDTFNSLVKNSIDIEIIKNQTKLFDIENDPGNDPNYDMNNTDDLYYNDPNYDINNTDDLPPGHILLIVFGVTFAVILIFAIIYKCNSFNSQVYPSPISFRETASYNNQVYDSYVNTKPCTKNALERDCDIFPYTSDDINIYSNKKMINSKDYNEYNVLQRPDTPHHYSNIDSRNDRTIVNDVYQITQNHKYSRR